MIDLEKLKPILQEIVPEDNMADAVLRIQEIDEEPDNSALEKANEENARLKEQNQKLTQIFFTGKNNVDTDVRTPDEPVEEEDEPETFEDLFDEKKYERGVTEKNG